MTSCNNLFAKCAAAESDQEDCALAPGVRREEVDDVIVVKSQTAGAEALGVRGKVKLATQNAGFQLYGAVSAVPVALQNLLQVGEEEDVNGGVGRELLFESQKASLVAEVPGLQHFESLRLPLIDVGAGGQAVHVVHDQVEIVEVTPGGIEKVCGNSSRGTIQHEGELRQGDGFTRELPCGTAARDHFLDGVFRNGIVGQLQRIDCSFGRRSVVRRCLAAHGGDLAGRIKRRCLGYLAHGGIGDFLFRLGHN